MFGLFKLFERTYPVLKPEMLEPVDVPITTTDAKKLYRQWMLRIRYLDKDEVSGHVQMLGEEIKLVTEYLREELADKKEEVRQAKEEYRSEVARLRSEVAEKRKELRVLREAAKDPAVEPELAKSELRHVESELDELKSDLDALKSEGSVDTEFALKFMEKAQAEYDAFRKDKREFLVRYINDEIHGGSQDSAK